jgi:hypothetical protein
MNTNEKIITILEEIEKKKKELNEQLRLLEELEREESGEER